jgi:signal transduction histidine kinase
LFTILVNNKLDSKKNGKSGSGVGLKNAYDAIRGMGGKIEVSSTLGQGTIFMIYLKRLR